MVECVTVTISATRGSTPRELGVSMRVFAEGQDGTIGGGALEFEAARVARDMLATGLDNSERVMPLGPGLGQCCGGVVSLRFERTTNAAEPTKAKAATPIWIWGAGHVGRALVDVLAPLPDVALTWVDFDECRYPETTPASVNKAIAVAPERLMPHAPTDARHIIVTHSHDLDLALCDAALTRGFAACGLIGSATKWARFSKRLEDIGHRRDAITSIECPIGDPALGKHPHAIAVGVAAALLREGVPDERSALKA